MNYIIILLKKVMSYRGENGIDFLSNIIDADRLYDCFRVVQSVCFLSFQENKYSLLFFLDKVYNIIYWTYLISMKGELIGNAKKDCFIFNGCIINF